MDDCSGVYPNKLRLLHRVLYGPLVRRLWEMQQEGTKTMTYQTLSPAEKEAFHQWLATDLLGWKLEDLDNACGDPDCCTPWPHVVWCKEITDETGAKIWVQVDPYLDEEWKPDTDRNHLAFVLERVGEFDFLRHLLCSELRPFLERNSKTWNKSLYSFDYLTAPPKDTLSALYAIKTEIEEALTQ